MKRLSAILFIFVMLLNTGAVAQALSQSELNSIYNDTVWYAPDSNFGTCSPASVSPGAGAPDGAQFPNLDGAAMVSAIDQWVAQQNPNSGFKGLGSTIVATAKNSNINPFLIIAIAKSESSLGDSGDFNVSHGNNSFGRTATSSQPNFSGARLWYRWSSVKASVDYTAPENVGAAGGGDMGTYLRDQYGGQLDSNNLTAMITQYAPPSENSTTQYITNVQNWINDLIKLSGQPVQAGDQSAAAPASSCGGSGSCTGANVTGTAAILCEAQKYDGIYYQLGGGHEAYSAFRQNCPLTAVAGAAASSSVGNPGPCATDCSGLVSVAVNAAYNLNYVWTVGGNMIGEGSQFWQKIPIEQAKAGDIVTTSEHVEIVDRVQGSSIHTFGSHQTGRKTSAIVTGLDYWTGAYRWTGPGGNQ